MLKSYLKLAWKVLLRRKFFTFISLFGIAFTLVVLMVATALLDNVVAGVSAGDQARAHGRHQLRVAARRALAAERVCRLRAARPVRARPARRRADVRCFHARGVSSYLNGQRLKSYLKRTDGAFWQILDFHFLEGGPYTESDVRDHRMVAVINDTTRQRFFGGQPALGRTHRGRRPALHRRRRRARCPHPAPGAVCRHLGAAHHGEIRQLHARVRRRLPGHPAARGSVEARADPRRVLVAIAHREARRSRIPTARCDAGNAVRHHRPDVHRRRKRGRGRLRPPAADRR